MLVITDSLQHEAYLLPWHDYLFLNHVHHVHAYPWVKARLSAAAVAETAREQQGASGNFPGPAPVVARAGFVHPLQLARAARDGAAAVGPAARPPRLQPYV
jgi:hypothetical protein